MRTYQMSVARRIPTGPLGYATPSDPTAFRLTCRSGRVECLPATIQEDPVSIDDFLIDMPEAPIAPDLGAWNVAAKKFQTRIQR